MLRIAQELSREGPRVAGLGCPCLADNMLAVCHVIDCSGTVPATATAHAGMTTSALILLDFLICLKAPKVIL